jgi:putative MATE family efflux protein
MINLAQTVETPQDISPCTQGQNIHRCIFKLALPAMASYSMRTLYQLIDAYWIGMLGSEALAALSGASFIIWSLYALSAIATTGTTTFVAQATGAKQPFEARFSAAHGFFILFFISLCVMITGVSIEKKLFLLMGLNPVVSVHASAYLRPILYGIFFSSSLSLIEGIFHGLGDTRTPMILLSLSLILNIVLDPLFIFGVGNFHGSGISGAAWATVLAQLSASVIGIILLIKRNFVPTFFYNRRIGISFKRLGAIVQIGAPVAFGGFSFSIIYVFLARIISLFGTSAVAAIGICHRIEGVAYFACMGFSVAATTLVGQNIGARHVDRAEKAAWLVNLYTALLLAFMSVIYYFSSHLLMSFFSNDPEVIRAGSLYLQIIALFEVFLGFEIIMGASFSGAGDTLPPLFVTFPLTMLRIPLAWYLSVELAMGVKGIWWAISGTTFLKGTIVSILFLMGKWKRKRVLPHSS